MRKKAKKRQIFSNFNSKIIQKEYGSEVPIEIYDSTFLKCINSKT